MIRSFSFFLLLLCSGAVVAQERTAYFYQGRPYGSESLINPASLILNAGLDILQSATHSRVLTTMHISAGLKNVGDNLADPFTQVRKFGWSRFIGQEVFPTSLSLDKAQWFPNYTLHLIGGGADSRMMEEWYTAHDIPAPFLFACLTVAAEHALNEAAENDLFVGPNVDPIADVYIFDLGGVLLFSSDAVAEFFGTTLQMTAWPGQAAWTPVFNTIENHGQNYVMRYPVPGLSSTKFFYHFGDNGLFGLSFLRGNGESVSVAGGATQKQLRTVDVRNGSRTVTVELGWMAGIFYDRDNSLLFSAIASDRINEKLRLNLYPGVIDLWGFSPGIFAALGSRDQFIAGFSVSYSPVGFALRNKL